MDTKIDEEQEEEGMMFPNVAMSGLGLSDKDREDESEIIKKSLFFARRKFTGLLIACVIF